MYNLNQNRLEEAKNKLSIEIKLFIDKAYDESKSKGQPISDGYFRGQMIAAKYFYEVVIDPQVSRKIDHAVLLTANHKSLKKLFKSRCESISIGWLLETCVTIKNTQKIVFLTIDYLRNQFLDHQFLDHQFLGHDIKEEIDYLYKLDDCLLLIKKLIASSKINKNIRKIAPRPLPFCALCWRLVQESGYPNGNEFEPKSRSFCIEHHPKINSKKYHMARRALFSAIKSEDLSKSKKLNSILSMIQSGKQIEPATIYNATNFILDRINLKEYKDCFEQNILDGSSSWICKAQSILKMVEKHYQYTYGEISKASIKNHKSWESWSVHVINLLDRGNNDSSNWEILHNEKNRDVNLKSYEYLSDLTLLNILHRYETTQALMDKNRFPRRKGPQKGTVMKNEYVRLKIKSLAENQFSEKMIINASQIAREVHLSRQRVNVILKELGFR
ncbi:hypothetical protein [Aeromonas salmonicida]